MIAESRTTVRSAGLLLVQRGVQIGAGFLTAILIPRVMGPTVYGRYALVTSLSLWFVQFSELGFTQIMGRFGPQFTDDSTTLRSFFERLLSIRFITGAISASIYLLLTILWLKDFQPSILLLLAAAVWVRAMANSVYSLFLGLNHADRWGMGHVIRIGCTLILVWAGFKLGRLRGAILGLLLTEICVLTVGMRWAKPYIARPRLRFDFQPVIPQIKFGLIFFASNLLINAFRRSGEAMVRIISGSYAEVGFFGLAYNIYLTISLVIPQLTLAFAPLFVSWIKQSKIDKVKRWAERLGQAIAIIGILAIYAVLILGQDLVPLILGSEYYPVLANLIPLMISLLVMAVSSVARLLTLVFDRPGTALAGAAIRLICFWALGPFLIGRYQSLGGCLTVLGALVIYAAFLSWQMRKTVDYSLRGWLCAILLGSPFFPLIFLKSTMAWNLILYVSFTAGYAILLLLFRVVTRDDIRAAWESISPRGSS